MSLSSLLGSAFLNPWQHTSIRNLWEYAEPPPPPPRNAYICDQLPYLLRALCSLCKIVNVFAHLKACSRRSDSKGWREMKNREKNAKAEEEVERRVRRSFALPRLAFSPAHFSLSHPSYLHAGLGHVCRRQVSSTWASNYRHFLLPRYLFLSHLLSLGFVSWACSRRSDSARRKEIKNGEKKKKRMRRRGRKENGLFFHPPLPPRCLGCFLMLRLSIVG